MKNLTLPALLWSASAALAHDGHGLSGSHWHATDAIGILGAALVAAGAWWFGRSRK